MSCSKEFLCEFIEVYRSFPCLWKIKSKEYSDRDLKAKAYDVMIEKLKEVDKNATRETVVKKINCLRTTFRKELKKVSDSEKSGAGEDDVYVPHLWYYQYLDFLRDQETPRDSQSNIDQSEDIFGSADDLSTTLSEFSPPFTPDTPQPSLRTKRKAHSQSDEVLTMIGSRLASTKQEDQFDLIGKTWANKLREINKDQRIYVEKLINDVLFEGQLQTLNRYSKIEIANVHEANKYYKHQGQFLVPQQSTTPQTQDLAAQYFSTYSNI